MDGLRFEKDKVIFEIQNFEFAFDNSDNLIARHTDTGNEIKLNSDGSINASALEAGGWSFIGEFQTLSDFESAATSGDRGYITDEQQFAYES